MERPYQGPEQFRFGDDRGRARQVLSFQWYPEI